MKIGPIDAGHYVFGFYGGNQVWVTGVASEEDIPKNCVNWFFIQPHGKYWVEGTSHENITITPLNELELKELRDNYCGAV